MIVRDVCAAVETLAPPGLAYPWDKAGLSIGDPEADVTALLVALTVTREALEAARTAGAEMIVSHHPLIWDPLPALRTDDPATRLCLDLAQAGIACYAAHSNLDVAPGGVNDVLADKVGLTNTAPLLPAPQATQVKLVTFVPEDHVARVREAVCQAGAGVIGDYTHCTFSAPGTGTFVPGETAQPFNRPSADGRITRRKHEVNEAPERRFETLVLRARLNHVIDALLAAHPYEEPAYDVVGLENPAPGVGLGVRGELAAPTTLDAFARQVRTALDVAYVRIVGEPERVVRRVAVLGGAGGGEIPNLPTDLDVYLTGDIKYHDALAARQRDLAIVDAGHAGTEKCVVPVLATRLERQLEAVRVVTFEEDEVFGLATA